MAELEIRGRLKTYFLKWIAGSTPVDTTKGNKMTIEEWKEIRSESWRNSQISKQAKLLWESKGCPQNMDDQIWLEAEYKVFRSDEADANHGPGSDF